MNNVFILKKGTTRLVLFERDRIGARKQPINSNC